MQVIGVMDLKGGRAVHGRAGRRESYAAVQAVAGLPIDAGDAMALARGYLGSLCLTELYAADLDAIVGRLQLQPEALARHGEALCDDRDCRAGVTAGYKSQDALVAAVAALGAPLWLDAGVSSADQARHALGLGAARVVVGLETLTSYDALEEICAAVGRHRVAFSLDLRESVPLRVPGGLFPQSEPAQIIAARAARAGASAVIVIDLARVGTGAGLDFGLIAGVRDAAPGLTLLAGGGVRGLEDLERLAESGCDGALVATALHDGRLGAADVRAVERLGRHGRSTR